MRKYFEELEHHQLSSLAAKADQSLGRRYEEPLSQTRTCFQRDRDRIIHCKAFRRLKHKTQVFIALESDHYRSRLTHTIEVAQIARHLARMLRLNEDLAEAISLAHDLGHTPFGHAGEKVLNKLMTEFGGFEHNSQSLRVVDELETKYPQFNGLNLCHEIRQGLMKHSTPYDNKGEFMGSSLEAQIADISDEIAYNNHDLDDGIQSGLLDPRFLESNVTLWREAKQWVHSQYVNLDDHQLFHLVNSHLISTLVMDVWETTRHRVDKLEAASTDGVFNATERLVDFSDSMREKNAELRKVLYKEFYFHHAVYRKNRQGQHIIEGLFNAFIADRKLLPTKYIARIGNEVSIHRVVCDYVSGMTDIFAKRVFDELF